MGAAASFHEQPESVQLEVFKHLSKVYEEEYLPKYKSGELNGASGFSLFKNRFEEIMVKEAATRTGRSVADVLAAESPCVFQIGDIVKAKLGFMMFEGVVVGVKSTTLDVDFGDDIEEIPIENCSLVMHGLDYEVGDLVSACPNGSVLYFNGRVLGINGNGTLDILFDGDEEDDVERNIPIDSVRKLRTGRQLVMSRWHRAKTMITASIAFGMSHSHSQDDS